MIFHRRNTETQTNSKKGQMKIFYMFSFFTFSQNLYVSAVKLTKNVLSRIYGTLIDLSVISTDRFITLNKFISI